MFVSLSIVNVEAGQEQAVEAAFANRPKRVDAFEGFLGLEVFRDTHKPGRIFLMTRWETRGHFQAYLKSDEFRRTHQVPHSDAHGGGLYQMESLPC